MPSNDQVPPYRWFQRRSDTFNSAWVEDLNRAFELIYDAPPFSPRVSLSEPLVPNVPWEPTPIDQMFLKSVGIKPE
jgi:hypothetical protein